MTIPTPLQNHPLTIITTAIDKKRKCVDSVEKKQKRGGCGRSQLCVTVLLLVFVPLIGGAGGDIINEKDKHVYCVMDDDLSAVVDFS